MNFYNPYYMPYTYARTGLFSNLFKGINFSSILNGASKTLNVVNQAIPVFKEISPIVKNAKTMFRVASELNKPNISKTNVSTIKDEYIYQDGPTFFK